MISHHKNHAWCCMQTGCWLACTTLHAAVCRRDAGLRVSPCMLLYADRMLAVGKSLCKDPAWAAFLTRKSTLVNPSLMNTDASCHTLSQAKLHKIREYFGFCTSNTVSTSLMCTLSAMYGCHLPLCAVLLAPFMVTSWPICILAHGTSRSLSDACNCSFSLLAFLLL